MFKSVLIANRGEIACRIARTASRLGMRTIAVYSDADRHALHVRLCDEAHRIGPPQAAESYLAIDKLIAAARASGAECVHPGYGFLAENADFAQACADAGIVFVGPPPQAMRDMGLKDRAKAMMEKAGVPVLPGYHGERQEPKFLQQKAYELGYPVMIKAAAGGGGRGMRRVDKHAEFEAALTAARREASSAFGDERMLVEKFVNAPRHIEVQVLADRHGQVIHLNERDCSLQRRHQKVIEETPAPGMNAEQRAAMGVAAVAAAKAVGYVGAGTVEFIADGAGGLRTDAFWFLEMNTRLQVEHPVTEAVTGLDLVEWQFRVADGEKLPLSQNEVPLAGHAVEARIYAEDPERGFLPSTGRLLALDLPSGEGIRVDCGYAAGDDVTPFYDPLIAKLIAHAETRQGALDNLAAALERAVIAGPRNNVSFLAALCRHADFRAGKFDTGFIDRNLALLAAAPRGADRAAAARGAETLIARENARIAAGIERADDEPPSPWDATDAYQLAGERAVSMRICVDGEAITAEIKYIPGGPAVTVGGVGAAADATVIDAPDAVYVLHRGRQTRVEPYERAAGELGHDSTGGLVRAPMHGKVLAILAEKGARVAKGQRLAVVEAMKMEHTLVAPIDGVIAEISAAVDSQLAEGAKVMLIEPEDTGPR